VPRSKNAWSYTSTPPIRLYGVVLIKKAHEIEYSSVNRTMIVTELSMWQHCCFNLAEIVFRVRLKFEGKRPLEEPKRDWKIVLK
jgi:hypothetical protein